MHFYSTYQVNYLGCYIDNIPRDLSADIGSNPSMTIESCYNECRVRNYMYAGPQY